MTELTGKTLGRYRVLERIGRGGMAEVYKAYQPALERHVAIKVLHSFLLEDEGSRERFSREAKAVAALRHPHIVQVFDFDNEGDEYFMVMEYVDGPNLKARLGALGRSHSRLSLDEIGGIITAIGGALAYAHRQGMIHRDVKPHNIMFTGAGHALLTDFGIAKIVSGSNVSASGTLSGTPAYMSPEQGRAATLDGRSDLYSLGVVLYEMLTGQVPFDADTPFAVVIKHINDPLPLPRTLDPTIPPSLERVVFKALAKDPSDRFQSADEFVQATQAAIADAATPDPTRLTLPYARPPADPLTTLPMSTPPPSTSPAQPTAPVVPTGGENYTPSGGTPTGIFGPPAGTLPPALPGAGVPPGPAQTGMQVQARSGRLSCSIVVGLVVALVLVAGAAGLAGERLGRRAVSAVAPTLVAIVPGIIATVQAEHSPVVVGAQVPPTAGAGLSAGGSGGLPSPSSPPDAAAPPPATPASPGAAGAQALAAQQYTAALAAYNAVLASDPNNSEALLGKAQALLGLARYQEAGDTAAAATISGGDNSAAQMIRAHANLMLGNQAAADTDYAALIAAHPSDPAPLRDRAEALLALNQPSAALTDLLKASVLAPDDGRTLVALGRAYAAAAPGVTPQPDKALDAFNRAIILNPQTAAAYAERGRFYATVKENRVQGLLDVTQAIKIGPPTAEWYRLRADIEGSQGYFNPQLADLSRAVELDPTNADLYRARAEVYLDQGQVDRAALQLDQAVNLAPSESTYLIARSLVRLLRNDTVGATTDAQAVITAAASDPDGYAALALVQFHTHDYAAALTQAQAAVQRSRADSKAADLALRGRIYVRLEQADKADADFQAALATEADNSDALLGQAELALLRRQPAAALTALDRRQELDTRYGWGLVLRAGIEAAAKESDKARTDLEAARKRLLFPDERDRADAPARTPRP